MKIEECINYLLTQAQIKVNQIFKENLSIYDITPAQYVLLYHFWHEDGLSPSKLSTLSGIDASTITGLLTRMEKKDFIKRKHSEEDRRGVNVFLTLKGKGLEESICQVIEISNQEILAHLKPKEGAAFKASLKSIGSLEVDIKE